MREVRVPPLHFTSAAIDIEAYHFLLAPAAPARLLSHQTHQLVFPDNLLDLMFALLLPSRPLISPTTLSPAQYAFRIPSVPSFNHLAIFLLPDASFTPDTGATIWIQLPSSPDFRLLGALMPDKPSAIYRVNSLGPNAGSAQSTGSAMAMDEGDVMSDAPDSHAGPSQAGEVVLGVQIEPLASVQAQVAALKGTGQSSTALVPASGAASGILGARPPVATKVLAQRIIQNAFDFLASFGAGDTVPLKAFQDWWRKFEGRIERDPGFLERAEG